MYWGKHNRNYPVTREITDQGAQLVISVVPNEFITKRNLVFNVK